jgi:hypothetical protein
MRRTHRGPAVTGRRILIDVRNADVSMVFFFIMILKVWETINFRVLFGRRTWPVSVERCWNTSVIWCEIFVLTAVTRD